MERYYSFSGTENGFTQGGTGEDIEGHINARGRGGNGCQSTPNYTKTSKKPTTFSSATVFTN
jgi:hypothetical protein